jgi:OOP family OmpA-OmpF porin
MKNLPLLVVFFVLLASIPFAEKCDAAIRPGAMTLSLSAGEYQFEGNQIIEDTTLEDSPVYDLAIGYNFSRRWALEGVFSYIDSEATSGPVDNVDVFAAHLDLLYHFRPEKDFVPYLAAGLGGFSIHPGGDSDENGLFNLGAGFKYFFTDNIGFRADVRGLLNIDDDDERERDVYKNISYTGGLIFQFGGGPKAPKEPKVSAEPLARDKDQDGVIDQYDRCPDTAEGVVVDASGCPQDRDGDGVPNFRDLCPGTPAGAVVDSRGCTVDTDMDGVPDGLDLCPDTAKGVAVDEKGCSETPMTDADGDGVKDDDDKCPNTPEGMPVNSYGCPRDNDGDGVFDFEDRCPDTPEGTAVGPDGCPLPFEAEPLTLGLEFESGDATVRPEFAGELERASDFIKAHPNSRIIIEGHTDSVGSASSNLALSQARAESVRDYLISHFGADAQRIEAKGYGEARPIEDNSTPEGRMQNRRVVITLIPGS